MPFHLKACQEKQKYILLECQHCGVEIPKLELNEHLVKCAAKARRRTAGAGPSQSGFPSSSSQFQNGAPQQLPAPSSAAPPPAEFFDEGGRLQCAVCGRWFAADRVATHQRICDKVNTKQRTPFDSSEQRTHGAPASLKPLPPLKASPPRRAAPSQPRPSRPLERQRPTQPTTTAFAQRSPAPAPPASRGGAMGGAISTSNEASPENPLAYPFGDGRRC